MGKNYQEHSERGGDEHYQGYLERGGDEHYQGYLATDRDKTIKYIKLQWKLNYQEY
jgi:hypothetical protein